MDNSTLQIIINAKDNASKVFKGFEKNNKESIKALKQLGVIGSGAAIAIGTASVKMAADFEKSMSNVSTLVDTNVENMKDMEKSVIDISRRTPVALEELTSALYDVRSAGISAEGAMEVLENSAILATTGLGTTKEATNILTSAINAFGLDAGESSKWADVFFKTVKSGKTTVAELAQGFGQVAPLANELGLKFEDLMATTAAMTQSGMQASVAYTQQRAVLSNLLKPTADMEEAMKKVGITGENLSEIISEKGLSGTIKILSDAVGGNQSELAKMFGSVEGLNAVMMLLNDTGVVSAEIHNNMIASTNAMDKAMIKQNETASAQYQILKNQLNAELINLGNKILPVLIESIPVMKQMWEDVKLTFDNVTDSLANMILKIWEAKDALKRIKEQISISNIGAGIGGVIQGGLNSVRIPHLASGGIVTRPTIAMIGEAGAEAVVPLNSSNGLGGITVNINGGTYLSESVAEEIGDMIIGKLKNQLRI
ncbi:MAG: phage tail tape measure protein [Patescibacteria group bacterium]|nr:phage tail tape measure protein [Patescibacteria group bacterium]